MKLKFGSSVKPGRISGGTYLVDDKMRADMFLPVWLLGLGIFLVMFGGIFGIVMTALGFAFPMIILFVALIALGIGAILCWKNQTIRMLASIPSSTAHSWVISGFTASARSGVSEKTTIPLRCMLEMARSISNPAPL